ncbi:MAG: hypothetical protein WCQ50_17405 [Spirochaetota bacterium]
MIRYLDDILKQVKKGKVSKEVFVHFNNAFESLDRTKDLDLFDVKKLKEAGERNYFRLRKGKHRAIFYIESDDIYVVALDKREDVYRKWL